MPSDRDTDVPVALEGAASLTRLGAALDDVELALLAQLHFAAGDYRGGLAAVRHPERSARGLSLIEARARFGLGEREEALAIVRALLAERPDALLARYYEAQFLSQSGLTRQAIASLGQLIGRHSDFPGALQSLAQLVLPGPAYREILRRLHDRLRPRTYLEVGVEHGTTLALAIHSEQAVGVDPVPRPPTRGLPAGARVFHTTSDAFFDGRRRQDVFGDRTVDLAFVDGMHWFEYALRDFHNVERWCSASSTIVLHDCLPAAAVAATRERQTTFWVGDTWKALEYLLRQRTDLAISVIPSYPSGLIVVQNLDPSSSISNEVLEARAAPYLPLEYPYQPGAWPSHYPIVPNDEPHLSRWLASLGDSEPARQERR
jgi:tetratricopeptide (TPR) repeat protein